TARRHRPHVPNACDRASVSLLPQSTIGCVCAQRKAVPGGDMNVTETTLKMRGADLLLRRAGKGPTLLFLHGAGGVPGWLPFFDGLSDRSDLLVPDRPSFGRSPLPPWLDDISDLAYFYLDVI